MWLASVSQWRDARRNIPVGQWGRGTMRKGRQAIAELLDGVGVADAERGFRMAELTLCAHRVVSDEELAVCPAERSRFLAGSGVEEMWRTPGFPASPLSLRRCEEGAWERRWVEGRVLRLPGDCGRCPPCLARAELEAGVTSGGG